MKIPTLRAVTSYVLLLGASFFIPFSPSRIGADDKVAKAKLTPDFCQTDETCGKLPNGGHSSCAPTVASNLLVYLDRAGFPNMLSAENPSPQDQFKLIQKLGSNEYMWTTDQGTSSYYLIQGLEKYVRERGYKIKSQSNTYLGDAGKYNVSNNPNPDWLKKKIDEGYEAILRIGFYYQDSYGDYQRYGGHYVTFVGFKDSDPKEILIHDPSRVNKKDTELKTELWKLTPYKDGYWEVDSGKERNLERTDVYLDGIIVFKVERN